MHKIKFCFILKQKGDKILFGNRWIEEVFIKVKQGENKYKYEIITIPGTRVVDKSYSIPKGFEDGTLEAIWNLKGRNCIQKSKSSL